MSMIKIVNFVIFIVIVMLSACSYKTISINEIEARKQAKALEKYNLYIDKEIKSKLNEHKYNYSKLTKSLEDINEYLYGNIDEVEIKLVANDKLQNIEALPDDSIITTTDFLEFIEAKEFTKDNIAAILCHESSHILNNDWTNRIREENSSNTLNYSTSLNLHIPTLNDVGALVGGFIITKSFLKKDIKFKDYVSENQHTVFQSNDEEDIKITEKNHSIPLNLLDSQGFKLDVEIAADKKAIECLKGIGINQNNMMIVLNKLLKSKKGKWYRLKTRIYNLKRHLNEKN